MTADPGRPSRRRVQDIDRHVGARIRERRALLALTQRQLADQTGVTFQQINKYERGRNQLTARRLYQIAQALRVDIGYFFEGIEVAQTVQPTAQQSLLLDLTHNSISTPGRNYQEAPRALAHTLADEELATAAEGAELDTSEK